MRHLLNVVYLTLIAVSSPWLLYSAVRFGKYREGWAEKLFGLVPELTPSPCRVWFHAVSVGEVNLLDTVLRRLAKAEPDCDVVISTTTKTGFGLAQRKYPQHQVCYCPLDFSWAVRAAYRRLKPAVLVLVELELWPNILAEAGRLDVPVAIINGRLSDRSTRGYRRLGSWLKPYLQNISLVLAQSPTCASRFIQLGIDPARVRSVGSMKFDGAQTNRDNPQTKQLAELAGFTGDELVLVAGSTQAPEEALAISVFRRLASRFPQLRLIIVPRHPERGEEVARLLEQSGLSWRRRSGLANSLDCLSRERPGPDDRIDVLLVDTVGELAGWWGRADIAFVGGSLGGQRGGQNMIEPAAYGVPTCFGPNTQNFRDIVEQLLAARAAVVVGDGEQLYEFVERCLRDTDYARELGHRGKQLVISQRGAAEETVAELLKWFGPTVAFSQQTGRTQDSSAWKGGSTKAPNFTRRRA